MVYSSGLSREWLLRSMPPQECGKSGKMKDFGTSTWQESVENGGREPCGVSATNRGIQYPNLQEPAGRQKDTARHSFIK